MEMENLRDLLIHMLRDLYSAEKQLLKALPKTAKAIENDELRALMEEHLEQTKEQVERLEQIFETLGKKPTGVTCKGMQGLLEEAKGTMGEDMDPDVMDAGLIVDQQKVEHYEIAGYGSAVTFAKLLGENEMAKLLALTLDEEEKADKKLTAIAKRTINVAAKGRR